MVLNPRPHVSEALLQLRRWTFFAGMVLIAAAVAQVLTFAVARYTQARHEELTSPAPNQLVIRPDGSAVTHAAARPSSTTPSTSSFSPNSINLSAIAAAPSGTLSSPRTPATTTTPSTLPSPAGAVQPLPLPPASAAPSNDPPAVNPNLVRSVLDRNLNLLSGLTCGAGLIAAMVLPALTFLTVIVTGGAGLPGVDRAVRAATWAVVITGLALPWGIIAGGGLMPGIFAGYDRVVAGAAAPDALSALAVFVALPLAAVVLCACVLGWMHRAVDIGVATLAEQEVAIEREMAEIRSKGPQARIGSGRALGALSLVLEDQDPQQPNSPPMGIRRAGGIS